MTRLARLLAGAAQAVYSLTRAAIMFFPDYARNGLSEYAVRQNAHTMTIVDDPILGPRRKVVKMTTNTGDGIPNNPNPRSQLEGPKLIREGDDFWVGWGTLLPKDFPRPTMPAPMGWISIMQLYGAGNAGAGGYPPFRLGFVGNQGEFGFSRESTGSIFWSWKISPLYWAWMDFAAHIRMGATPAEGFVELWINFGSGWQLQTLTPQGLDEYFADGRLHMKTFTGPTTLEARTDLQNYRRDGMFETCTLYHADHKQGASLASVDPRSYSKA